MFRLRLLIPLMLLAAAGCGGQTPEPPTREPVTEQPTAPPITPSAEVSLDCGQIIRTALQSVGATCTGLGRNQACYGHAQIEAEFRANVGGKFAASGDVVDLLAIKRLHTIPPDEQAKIWGVAVIKAQVNLPDSLPGQNVTFLLFGDTSLDGITPDMRAVTLTTGVGETKCKDAPPSSLLVQSPKGQQVAMNINGADITVGSTLFVTAQQRAEMKVATIEGEAKVSANNVTQIVQPGAQVRLPLGGGSGLQVSGPPSPPEPFETLVIQQAPLVMLERPVLVPQPITPAPTPTPALTPTPGGANFRADATSVKAGECTTIRWDVQEAKSVIFEGQPTRASSLRQVCPKTTTTYTLLVTRNDGAQEFYNVTVAVQ